MRLPLLSFWEETHKKEEKNIFRSMIKNKFKVNFKELHVVVSAGQYWSEKGYEKFLLSV